MIVLKRNFRRKISAFVCCFLIGIFFLFLYPKIILKIYGNDIPIGWSNVFSDMSFDEIYKKIGKPQEDVSGKDYQNWIVYQWWGWKQLKIISPYCCQPSSKPTSILYIVHLYGWYNPIFLKKITQPGKTQFTR